MIFFCRRTFLPGSCKEKDDAHHGTLTKIPYISTYMGDGLLPAHPLLGQEGKEAKVKRAKRAFPMLRKAQGLNSRENL